MKLWGYYAFHTFINSIKKMFRSTFIIVFAAIIGIGLIFGVSVGLIASAFDNATEENVKYEEREGYGDPEYGYFNEEGTFLFYDDLYDEGLGGYDENGDFIYYEDAEEQGLGYYDEFGDFVFYYEEFSEEDIRQILLVVEAASTVIILLLLFWGAYSGTKKGSDIFLMADVNFLFTAPMKPQSVLLFRLTFQMLGILTGTVYLLFQIPNLVVNADVPLAACLVIYAALLLAFVFQKLCSVGMYTVSATREKVKKYVLPILLGIAAVLLAVVGYTFLAIGKDVWKTLELTLSAKWTRLIPIVGWLKGIVIHAIDGNVPMVLLYLGLTFAGMVVLVYLIWHIKADFYEDAMSGAQAREDLVQAASENRKMVEVNTDGTKKKEKRKVKELQQTAFGKSSGASVFFTKELLVRKRLAKGGFITNTMIWYLGICACMAVLNMKIMETTDFTLTGIILMVVVFFRNMGNPIAQETSMNWIFLVPESAYKKVFYAMLAGTYATAMDLLPGLIFSLLLGQGDFVTVLISFITMVTMDFMLSGVGLLLEALFPASAMDMVKGVIQIMLKFGLILVIAIVMVLGIALGGFIPALLLTLVFNLIVGAIAFIIYPSIMHEGIA